jgi:hypothetical protein
VYLCDPDGKENFLMFHGYVVHSMRWIAPWAVGAIRGADCYELDASFRAIKPYVYAVPSIVSQNVGIPLGLVLGPSESSEMFTVFAEGLIEQGVGREELSALPLLSDEGTALLAYGRIWHEIHRTCFRHWLEGLGSKALPPMLARRLLFARTRAAFLEILPQTLSDFAAGCRANEITEAGQKKFAAIFGIHLPLPDDPLVVPIIDLAVFERQALWGVRGSKGVSTCSNHVEGLHGRLNRATRPYRGTLTRLAAVLELLTQKADDWRKNVVRAQR